MEPVQQIVVEEKIVKYNGEVQIKKYLRGKFLGKGGFAKCYEIVNQDTKVLSAAKVVQKSSLTKSRAKQKLMSEIKIHRSVHHQHVVKFEVFGSTVLSLASDGWQTWQEISTSRGVDPSMNNSP